MNLLNDPLKVNLPPFKDYDQKLNLKFRFMNNSQL